MKRDYGIDLLKMVAMMMVVAHHILQGGGVGGKFGGVGGFIEESFHCFCYCAVDCFVMVTGYIMCRHAFKYVRIFRLWRQFVGYSLFFVVLGWLFLPAGTVGWRHWIGAAMPVLTNANWFLTQYFALFFTIPFLNKMLDALSGREKGILLLSGFCLLSVMPSVAGKDLFVTTWGYSYVWFLYLYVLGASLVDVRKIVCSSGLLALGATAGSILSAGCAIAGPMLTVRFGGGGRIAELAYSYASPTMLLEAVCLVLIFAKIEVRNLAFQRMISILAPSTFIVFVVHTDGMFKQLVGWRHAFTWMTDYGVACVVAGTIAASVLVYAVIVSADVLRRMVVRRLVELFHGSD